MKRRPAPSSPAYPAFRIAALPGLVMLPSLASATTYTWSGGATGSNWAMSANWTGNQPPQSNRNTTLVFAGSTQLNPVEDINSTFALNSLAFDGTADAICKCEPAPPSPEPLAAAAATAARR